MQSTITRTLRTLYRCAFRSGVQPGQGLLSCLFVEVPERPDFYIPPKSPFEKGDLGGLAILCFPVWGATRLGVAFLFWFVCASRVEAFTIPLNPSSKDEDFYNPSKSPFEKGDLDKGTWEALPFCAFRSGVALPFFPYKVDLDTFFFSPFSVGFGLLSITLIVAHTIAGRTWTSFSPPPPIIAGWTWLLSLNSST